MNEKQTIVTAPPDGFLSGLSFLGLMIVLAKHKKFVILMPLIVAFISGAISFVLPNVYKASTTLLPPQQPQSGTAALLSQLGGVAGGVTGIKNPNDLYIGMLKSRTVADRLVAHYNLIAVYNTNSLDKTREMLARNTSIATGKDGLITIVIEDLDKSRVAKIANSYVEELLRLTKILAVTEASHRRLFFEQQLELTKNNLATAELALKDTLDARGVISVDSDSRAIVETVARLRAQISAKEIQISSLREFVTVNNQDYKRAQEELNSTRAELYKLENGRPSVAGEGVRGVGKQVGLENIKVLREVKYHQMLYELLSKQYEAARLDEAKSASIVQVLDEAIEPERKFKPRRAIIVLLAFLFAIFAAIASTLIFEANRMALKIPGRAMEWTTLRNYLRFR